MKKSILLLGILTGLVAVSCYAQTAQKMDNFAIEGLKENVVVRRDDRSIPYIEAKNDSDIYFMQGYETARDRLWQMDLYRRVARGRLAELFGKTVLDEDKRWRRFGFSEIAEESLRLTEPGLKRALDDYARGVNAYISTLDKKTLPIEFQILQYQPEPWQATDTIVIGKILADGLSTTWWQDIERINLQELPKAKYDAITSKITPSDLILFGSDGNSVASHPAVSKDLTFAGIDKVISDAKAIRKSSLERVGFYEENLAASNNWVVSGKRTADGKAMLANDPHLQGTAPGIWYLINLSTPTMRVSGVTFPGVPGVVLGHNESIAWGATNVGPDVQDVYFEEFNEKGEYRSPAGWKKPKVRSEEMKFRPNQLSPKLESEVLEVVETRNGIIFNEKDGK
ncbi:MAG: penicillin acylase family protein, partial [Acidobacteria bacterium]|nr:penicillin acylase family protein [Acidobacteriota bacterium]